MKLEFFLPILPPTITAQQQKTGVRNGKPYRYDPPELKAARGKLLAYLAMHRPKEPIPKGVPVRLVNRWCFPIPENGGHSDGEYKVSKPDTDNAVKLLKDCMTAVGFWADDAQVASELNEKFWARIPGIYIRVEALA